MGLEGLTFFSNCMCSLSLPPLSVSGVFYASRFRIVWKIVAKTCICEVDLCHRGSGSGLGFIFQRFAAMLQ